MVINKILKTMQKIKSLLVKGSDDPDNPFTINEQD